ncbi:MAG: hypothetical protein WAV40_05245 [Microgenomates group bacterium]
MLTVSTQVTRGDSLSVFEAMLKSVTFADELIIFNMERTDKEALNLFAKYKAKVVDVKTPKIVESIRSDQIQAASGDWALIMDYDEIITDDLAGEIKAITENLASCSAYAIGRDNYSLGYPLKHGGWERDYVVRLIRKKDFVSWGTNIHSQPVFKGSTIKTSFAMEHHKDASLAQMVTKTNRYSDIEAQQFFAGGLPPATVVTLLRKSVMEFIRRYFLKRGCLDGRIGLFQSLYQGYSVFISYAKLYEKQFTQGIKNHSQKL